MNVEWDDLQREFERQRAMLVADYPRPTNNKPATMVESYRMGLHVGFEVALVAAAIALGDTMAEAILLEEVNDGIE